MSKISNPKTMREIALFVVLLFCSILLCGAQTEFVVEPTQSMLMTGKGPGQDATINPFDGEDCVAIIKNLGDFPMSVRIENGSQLVDETQVDAGTTLRQSLPKGYQLYLDPIKNFTTTVSVDYSKD